MSYVYYEFLCNMVCASLPTAGISQEYIEFLAHEYYNTIHTYTQQIYLPAIQLLHIFLPNNLKHNICIMETFVPIWDITVNVSICKQSYSHKGRISTWPVNLHQLFPSHGVSDNNEYNCIHAVLVLVVKCSPIYDICVIECYHPLWYNVAYTLRCELTWRILMRITKPTAFLFIGRYISSWKRRYTPDTDVTLQRPGTFDASSIQSHPPDAMNSGFLSICQMLRMMATMGYVVLYALEGHRVNNAWMPLVNLELKVICIFWRKCLLQIYRCSCDTRCVLCSSLDWANVLFEVPISRMSTGRSLRSRWTFKGHMNYDSYVDIYMSSSGQLRGLFFYKVRLHRLFVSMCDTMHNSIHFSLRPIHIYGCVFDLYRYDNGTNSLKNLHE